MQLGNWLIHVKIYYFIVKWLIASDYDIHSNFAIFLFCLTFGLSVLSLGLFIFEIMAVESLDTRNLYWRLTFTILVSILIYILPGVLIRKILQHVTKNLYLKTVFGIFIFVFYLSTLIYYCQLDITDLPRHLDFITKIGTVMIGVLSGFGAVYCPWAYF